MKNKGILKKIFLHIIAFLFIFLIFGSSILAQGQYQNQEKIPGAGQTSDVVQYIKDIIGFGYATIGILAMFMLGIGAYQYLMAAGNITKIESARETIGSAIFGLVLGLLSWIILSKIHPDLVAFKNISGGGTVNQSNAPGSQSGSTGTGSSGGSGAGGGGGGTGW